MRLFSMRCPECGGAVEPPAGRKYGYCPYCGTKYIVDDGILRVEINQNVNKTANDEYARVSEAAAKAKIAEEERKETRLVLIFGVAMFVFLFSVMLLATIKTSSESAQPVNQAVSTENSSTITLLHSSDEYVDEEWELVQKDLASRGFTNIVVTVEKNSKDPGTVASVTIDGKRFKAGDAFTADAEVVIKYRAEKLFK